MSATAETHAILSDSLQARLLRLRRAALQRRCAIAAIAYTLAVDSQQPPPIVPPQIPVRLQRYEETSAPAPAPKKFWLHPASGLLILAVDWLFFAPEALTAEVAAIVTCPLAFLITTAGVFWIQRRKSGDATGAALAKALLGGILAGLPTPISGTIFGTLVLVLSGLSGWNQRRGAK